MNNNKNTLIASLKRKKFKKENKELREQRKVNYPEVYKQL